MTQLLTQAENIVWHNTKVTRSDRNRLNRHRSFLLWITGLSGAGKSTLAIALEKELYDHDIRSYVLDGDNIRHGLSSNLGFSPKDRKENMRRIGEVSSLFIDAGLVVLTSFISPYREDRQAVRERFGQHEFVEIYVKCSLEVCESRDPKGLYKKARNCEIQDFTGISAPYEVPEHPEIVVETDKQSIAESVSQVIQYLLEKQYF